MLTAIAELGDYRATRPETQNENLRVETPRATSVIAVTFDLSATRYAGIGVEQCDPNKAADYYLTDAPSSGASLTPTAMVTDEASKSFNMRIVGWFKRVDRNRAGLATVLTTDQQAWLDRLFETFDRELSTIEKEFCATVEATRRSSKDSLLATLRFQDGDTWRGVGDATLPFAAIAEYLFENEIFASSSGECLCAVCTERKPVSSRMASEVFPFAGFDKISFVSGFDPRTSWRNLPVCQDCYLRLKRGRRHLDQVFSFKFSGIRYWLVPKFSVDTTRNSEALTVLEELQRYREQNLTDSVQRKLIGSEGEVLSLVAEQNDFLTLTFLFIEEKQSMMRILLASEDVLPSRLRRLFDAKDMVEATSFVAQKHLRYDFRCLQPFFSKKKAGGKTETAWQAYLNVVGSIVRGQRLDRATLMRVFMERIRQDFAGIASIKGANDEAGSLVTWREKGLKPYWNRPLDAWMNLAFLTKLDLLTPSTTGGNTMSEPSGTTAPDFVQEMHDFFFEHEDTFYSDATKAVFLMGAMTQLLLNVQNQERGATPFLSSLKGLRLGSRDLRVLFPKVQAKLQEYERIEGYGWAVPARQKLASAASYHFVAAGADFDRLSVDESSFYFVLGMNLFGTLRAKLWSRSNAPRPDDREAVVQNHESEYENVDDENDND